MTTKRTLGIQFLITALALGATPWLLEEQPAHQRAATEMETTSISAVQGSEVLSPVEADDSNVADNEISFEDYIEEFGGLAVLDLKTRTLRTEVTDRIHEELVGTEVTWDGYVSRVAEAAAGGGTLVLGMKESETGLDAALVRVSPDLYEEVQTYQAGDHMRVVARFDGIRTVFPLLSGRSVELISRQ